MLQKNQLPRNVLLNWKVLVVDDDPGGLRLAQFMLGYYGAMVRLAWNGQEGFSMAHEECPRFILSDLSMPVMDGWDMLKKLRDDPVTATIPVVALTAHAMRGDRERALAAGFHCYVTKPLNPATFVPE